MSSSSNNGGKTSWSDIIKEIGKGKVEFIRDKIKKEDININEKHCDNGKTLLIV